MVPLRLLVGALLGCLHGEPHKVIEYLREENRVLKEPAVRALTRSALIRQGYRVIEAATGVEACELLENRSEPIDLVLTDVVMPGKVEDGPRMSRRRAWSRLAIEVALPHFSGWISTARAFPAC